MKINFIIWLFFLIAGVYLFQNKHNDKLNYVKEYFHSFPPPDTPGGPPKIDSVTVLPDSTILIKWTHYQLPALKNYLLYRYTGYGNMDYEKKIDKNYDYYVDITVVPNQNFYGYKLAYEYDSAGVIRKSPVTALFRSIYVQLTQYDTCRQKIILKWNTLEPPAFYFLYKSNSYYSGYQFQNIQFQNDSTCLLTVSPDEPVQFYKLLIKKGTSTTTSNIIKINTSRIFSPDTAYAISVMGFPATTIKFGFDSTHYVKKIELNRSINQSRWETVDNIQQQNGGTVYFNQNLGSGNIYQWYISIYNTCDSITALSDTISNIKLVAYEQNSLNFLEWNRPFNKTGIIYSIYRIIDNQVNFVAATTAENFNEQIEFEEIADGKVCYQITSATTGKETCWSNIACIEKDPVFEIPEGFTPNGDGLNDTFNPRILFGSHHGYLFEIYSRWGQTVFSTTDIDKSWDGKLNGNQMPEGKYLYYIRIKSQAGKIFEKRGDFILRKP